MAAVLMYGVNEKAGLWVGPQMVWNSKDGMGQCIVQPIGLQ